MVNHVYKTPSDALRGLADREPAHADELRAMAKRLDEFHELYHSDAWTEEAHLDSLSCLVFAYKLWHDITDDSAFMDAVKYKGKQEGRDQ